MSGTLGHVTSYSNYANVAQNDTPPPQDSHKRMAGLNALLNMDWKALPKRLAEVLVKRDVHPLTIKNENKKAAEKIQQKMQIKAQPTVENPDEKVPEHAPSSKARLFKIAAVAIGVIVVGAVLGYFALGGANKLPQEPLQGPQSIPSPTPLSDVPSSQDTTPSSIGAADVVRSAAASVSWIANKVSAYLPSYETAVKITSVAKWIFIPYVILRYPFG